MQAQIVLLRLMLGQGPPSVPPSALPTAHPSVHRRGYLHSLSLPIVVEGGTASSGPSRHVEGQGGGAVVNALEEEHMKTSALPFIVVEVASAIWKFQKHI